MAEKMHFMEFNDKNFFVGSSAGLRVAEGGGGLEGWRSALSVSVHCSTFCTVAVFSSPVGLQTPAMMVDNITK